MGILQSFMKSSDLETDHEEEDTVSSQNCYDLNYPEKSEYARLENVDAPPGEWQNRNPPTRSHESKHLTISVPEFRGSSSLAHTCVNDKVKKSGAFVKENDPPNVGSNGRRHRRRYRRRHREEVPVMIKHRAVEKDRWIKHYSSCHRILLVGEGDFSFSTCLASAFGLASNVVATSLDSQGFLVENYGSALSNLVELGIRKCRVMHGINATKMASHHLLGRMRFDRIIFNFPFAGFFKELPREDQIRLHRALVSKFLENAKEMLSKNGEIHITHKTNGFHKEWKVCTVAYLHGLSLVEEVEFDKVEYPGYNTKCGFGGDKNFNCNPSMTYKFRLL